MPTALTDRIKTYMEWLPNSHPQDEGKYALICRGQVTVHDSPEAAQLSGFDNYGSMSEFLVVKIERNAPTQIPALQPT